jgi:hypothetical protein
MANPNHDNMKVFGDLPVNSVTLFNRAQAVVSVGGAATKCQHQSPCFDTRCQSCYDPLLRIHGLCGGASYFTCKGTLPKICLPLICTYKVFSPPPPTALFQLPFLFTDLLTGMS